MRIRGKVAFIHQNEEITSCHSVMALVVNDLILRFKSADWPIDVDAISNSLLPARNTALRQKRAQLKVKWVEKHLLSGWNLEASHTHTRQT